MLFTIAQGNRKCVAFDYTALSSSHCIMRNAMCIAMTFNTQVKCLLCTYTNERT